jgi:hypothetical protein
MWKERGFLKNITHPPAMNREIHAFFLIEVDDSINPDQAGIGLNQSRDRVKRKRLA